jgi:cell wall-associated NlpC family hydrolase
VSIAGEKKSFLELTNGGFVFAKHIQATEFAQTNDYVFTAGRLLHVPYLWGGRTSKGIDCSGLVQLALEMAGIDAPRDSDQQLDVFGKPLQNHWRDHTWQRGDIVFFKGADGSGHLGFMTGIDNIIHASTNSMDVTVEPLADLVMRGLEVIGMAATENFRR